MEEEVELNIIPSTPETSSPRFTVPSTPQTIPNSPRFTLSGTKSRRVPTTSITMLPGHSEDSMSHMTTSNNMSHMTTSNNASLSGPKATAKFHRQTNGMETPPNSLMEEPVPDLFRTKAIKRSMNKRKRVVLKGGFTNVEYKNISKRRRRYFSDLYTTLLDAPWTYCLLIFGSSFYISWLLFAVTYWLIAFSHGDLDFRADCFTGNTTCCIKELDSFSACFLFSLETQHTIGYGSRQTTTQCPEAMAVMSLQAVVGCMIQAFMVGLVFAKLARPSLRSKTVIFSQNAVIFERNRKLCLAFRIGDLRDDNFILGTQISAKMMRRVVTMEGEMFQEMHNIKTNPDTSTEPCIFFVWPLEVIHTIDTDSPFYNMTAADLTKEKFEIVVLIEGTIESTSMAFQARSSYLPNEVLWGHRYEPMMLFRKDHNKFQVNFSAFHSTYEVDTPLCSASELHQYYQSRDNWTKQQHNHTRTALESILRPTPIPRAIPVTSTTKNFQQHLLNVLHQSVMAPHEQLQTLRNVHQSEVWGQNGKPTKNSTSTSSPFLSSNGKEKMRIRNQYEERIELLAADIEDGDHSQREDSSSDSCESSGHTLGLKRKKRCRQT